MGGIKSVYYVIGQVTLILRLWECGIAAQIKGIIIGKIVVFSGRDQEL